MPGGVEGDRSAMIGPYSDSGPFASGYLGLRKSVFSGAGGIIRYH